MAKQHKETKSTWKVLIVRFSAFNNILRRESERGSVIVSAALMDEALEQLLKAKLVPSAERNDELFTGSYAPLSTFSAKIDFAYRVGVIGLNLRSSLHLIRKLRNDFAHSSMRINFDSQQVHNRIQELFKLNKELLDAIWEFIKSAENKHLMKIIGNHKSEPGVDYLSRVWGWRSTFEVLCSIIAASLHIQLRSVAPLVSRDENKAST